MTTAKHRRTDRQDAVEDDDGATIPPPRRRNGGDGTDADALFTLTVRRKTLVMFVSLISSLSGLGVWKSFSADDAASDARRKAVVVGAKTDAESGAFYDLWKRDQADTHNELNHLAGQFNALLVEYKELRDTCAPRRRRQRTEPTPIVLPPKPHPPETPEAAAAAAAATPPAAPAAATAAPAAK